MEKYNIARDCANDFGHERRTGGNQKNNEVGCQEGRMERKGEEKRGGLGEDNGEEETSCGYRRKVEELDGEITLQATVQRTLDMSGEQEEQKTMRKVVRRGRMERNGEGKHRKERE